MVRIIINISYCALQSVPASAADSAEIPRVSRGSDQGRYKVYLEKRRENQRPNKEGMAGGQATEYRHAKTATKTSATRHTVCSGNNLGSIQVQLRFNFTLKQRRTGTKRQLHPCCPPSRTASSHTPTPMPAIRITGNTPTPTAGKSAHTRLIAHAQPLAFRRSVMRSRYSQ